MPWTPRVASRRQAMLGLGTLAALSGPLPGRTLAQGGYPDRPVTLVVPFAAGGSTDLVARLVAAGMTRELGRQVVVENRGGAGGNLGAAAVARAAPDGHTVLMGTVATHALNPALYASMPYDAARDFAPVSLLALVPNVLVVHPGLPARSVAELVGLLRAAPGRYAYASAGNGTPAHLSAELFEAMAGVEMLHVPYKGAGPALVDVIGGRVPVMFDNLPPSLEHIRAGRLRALGVTTRERVAAAPDLPTVAEALPGYETYSWNALFAPAGTPGPIVARLNAAALAALADPEVAARLGGLGAAAVGSTPEELAAHVRAELAKWAPVVRASGARLE